jgi:5-methylcytosine-specific restriction endonuclease McrA
MAPITHMHLQLLREAQDHRCRYCRVPLVKGATHLDHRTPLSRGGAHEPSNVCLACASCNLKKHAMTEAEFLQRIRRAAA